MPRRIKRICPGLRCVPCQSVPVNMLNTRRHPVQRESTTGESGRRRWTLSPSRAAQRGHANPSGWSKSKSFWQQPSWSIRSRIGKSMESAPKDRSSTTGMPRRAEPYMAEKGQPPNWLHEPITLSRPVCWTAAHRRGLRCPSNLLAYGVSNPRAIIGVAARPDTERASPSRSPASGRCP